MNAPVDDRSIEERLQRALAQAATGSVADSEVPPPFDVTPRRATARVARPRFSPPLLAAAAVVLVVAGSALAVRLIRSDSTSPGPAHIRSSVTPTVPAPRSSPTPSASASPVGVRAIDLRNATIDIPTWAPFARTSCPAGPHTFVDGQAPAARAGGFQNRYILHVPPEPQNVPYGAPVYGDLDGKAGDDILVELSCNGGGSLHPVMLLALALSAGGNLHTLGVVNTLKSTYLAFDPTTVRISDRTVVLDTMGEQVSNGGPVAAEQTRGYRYENGRFVQVSGPTTFPPVPADVRAIDPRNTTVELADFEVCVDACRVLPVRFVNGKGHAIVTTQRANGTYQLTSYDYTVDGAGFSTMGAGHNDVALVTVTRRGPGGATVQATFGIATSPGQLALGWPVLRSGADGILGIVSATGRDAIATVVVRTATGNETRRYRADSPDAPQGWTRIS